MTISIAMIFLGFQTFIEDSHILLGKAQATGIEIFCNTGCPISWFPTRLLHEVNIAFKSTVERN